MKYTIRTKDEYKAEYNRHPRLGDNDWIANIEPSLFFDKEVAGKVLRRANADDGSDRYLLRPWASRHCCYLHKNTVLLEEFTRLVSIALAINFV